MIKFRHLACRLPALILTCPFSSNNNNGNSNSNSNSKDRDGPQVISVSKQQYLKMKRFLQDIKMSMPITSTIPNPTDQRRQHNNNNTINDNDDSNQQVVGGGLFWSPQQKLSFQLLKLSTPHQLLPIFKQHTHSSPSVQLMVLHRYISLGGTINNMDNNNSRSRESVQGYGRMYMQSVLMNMGELQEQQELQQILQLYITLNIHNNINNNIHDSNNNLHLRVPLLPNPSHSNSTVLVLLMQYIDTHNTHNNNNNNSIQYSKVLQHYYLDTDKQYPVQQLGYLSVFDIAYPHSHQHTILDMFIHALHNTQCNHGHGYIIQGIMNVVENVHRIHQQTYHSHRLLDSIIHALKSTSTSLYTHQQQQHDGNNNKSIWDLLYTSLLKVQQNQSQVCSKWASSIAHTIIHTQQQQGQQQRVSMNEYIKYWRSAMVMYKIVNSQQHNKQVDKSSILHLVNKSINKYNKNDTNQQQQQQQQLEQLQQGLFDCIVAYTLILPEQITSEIQKYSNIDKQIHNRQIIKQLLTNYSNTINKIMINQQKQITDSDDLLVHNMSICAIIADKYKIKQYFTCKNDCVQGILSEWGTKHKRYGQVVKTIMQK